MQHGAGRISRQRLQLLIVASLFIVGSPSRALGVAVLSKAPKQVTIQIFAAGVTNDEIIELELDGTVVAVFENVGGNAYAGEFVTLNFTDPQIDSITVLRINFTNDLVNGTYDRNVRIDAVVVDGQRYETEDPAVYSEGSWRKIDGCSPGFKQSEFLNCDGFFEFRLSVALNPIVGTFGETTIAHLATEVSLPTPLANPVIIASVPTFNDTQPGTIGIDGVNDKGFVIRFRHWEYLNPNLVAESLSRSPLIDDVNPRHGAEAAEWLALEQGVYSTADGSIWEVGTFNASDNNNFVFKAFEHDFDTTPIVFATLQSANGPPVAVRIRNVSANGFVAALFEEEAQLASQHPLETVGYLAIGPGAESGIVTIDGQTFPYLFENLQIDHNAIEVNNRLSLFLQEETSFDSETLHAQESVSVMTLGSKVYAHAQTYAEADPFTLRSIRRSAPISLPPGFEFTEVLGVDAFENAVAMEIDQSSRIFVAEESGVIWLVINGVKNPVPYLDISDKVANEFADTGGFSGFALDPDFSTNGWFYVMYTTEVKGQPFGRVERYQQSFSNPDSADPASSFILLGNNATDGLRKANFHNVGDLEFGADGSLFLSWGDTASNDENDPDHFLAQDINTPAGKILRINPASGLGFPSNPYYTGNGGDVASKVWAFGLRNGFRIEHVPRTGGGVDDPGMIIVADVGRNDFEEIDVVLGGENLGWPYFEANQRFRLGGDGLTLTFPAIAYPHPGARSVIGGAFYQGTQWPAQYNGQFFVSDFVTGWLRSYVVNLDGSLIESNFGLEVKGMTDMKFNPSSDTMYLVGRGRDIIFDQGEGLDGLYSIKFVGE